jgi:hypothetical protein
MTGFKNLSGLQTLKYEKYFQSIPCSLTALTTTSALSNPSDTTRTVMSPGSPETLPNLSLKKRFIALKEYFRIDYLDVSGRFKLR